MTEEQAPKRKKRTYNAQKEHERYLKEKDQRMAKREERRKANLEEFATYQRERRRNNPEINRLRVRKWYYENREHALALKKKQRDLLRLEMINEYGGKCICCGETNPGFLTIDHLNGGGTAHREGEGGAGNSVTNALKREGWPKEGYQLLCYNCNCGRQHNAGICPHNVNRFAHITTPAI